MIKRTLLIAAGLLVVAAGCQQPTAHAAHPASGGPSPSTSVTTTGGPAASDTAASPPAGPTAPGGTLPAVDRCHTAQLVGRFQLSANGGAAGNRYGALSLANRGATCRIYGYPGMQLYDAAGHALPTNVVRTSGTTPTLVTLVSGATAWAEMHWSVVNGTGDNQNGQCQPTSSSAQVTPPDETTQLTVPIKIYACERGTVFIWPMASAPPFPLE